MRSSRNSVSAAVMRAHAGVAREVVDHRRIAAVSWRSACSQNGFGRLRTSNTKSASPGYAMLVAEGLEHQRQAALVPAVDAFANALAQRMNAHVRGVDDQVGRDRDRFEQLALRGDRLAQAESCRVTSGCLRRVSA